MVFRHIPAFFSFHVDFTVINLSFFSGHTSAHVVDGILHENRAFHRVHTVPFTDLVDGGVQFFLFFIIHPVKETDLPSSP